MNRQTRRASGSKRGKKKASNGSSNGSVQLTAAQRSLLAKGHQALTDAKCRVADLENEKARAIVKLRQLEEEFSNLVSSSLQAHGVDLRAPGAGTFNLDLNTFEVTHTPSPGPIESDVT